MPFPYVLTHMSLCSFVLVDFILLLFFSEQIGRLLIRHVVSFMLHVPFNHVSLARSDKGKPFTLNCAAAGSDLNPGCHFNMSHHGDVVVIAAELNKLIGIDVMKVEWPRELFLLLFES